VRLDQVSTDELAELITESYRIAGVPKGL
jgi:hypothetical protein